MKDTENIQDSNTESFDCEKYGAPSDTGRFNVFKLEPYVGENARPVPYKRRNFYKITMMIGQGKIHYADKVVEIQKQALVFSNPNIPYKWEHTDKVRSGYFCVFTRDFFQKFGDIHQYEVFQPNGIHVFDLTDEQVEKVTTYYERMFQEINSDYIHKYDLLRTIAFELLHFAMKMQPLMSFDKQVANANKRIAGLFMELLERQFPIDDTYQKISLRSASEFAEQLNIHVNHLNRAVKETSLKTTSQLIAERVLQESKVLLKQTSWSVSEIAFALGFTEVTHFNNFFKKHVQVSPLRFRNV
jgi:AraC-like DNA-binding protein